MVSLILTTSQIGPRLLFASSLLHLKLLLTCHTELFKTGTEGGQAKNEFNDHLACLLYDSSIGVFADGKLHVLAFQLMLLTFFQPSGYTTRTTKADRQN